MRDNEEVNELSICGMGDLGWSSVVDEATIRKKYTFVTRKMVQLIITGNAAEMASWLVCTFIV